MGNPTICGFQLRADGHGVTVRSGDMMRFLKEVVPAIGMTLLPETPDFTNPSVSEGHGQGIAVIAESHIWIGVEGSDATCIVFSCRPFSKLIVHAMLRQTFGGQWVTRYELQRSVPPTSWSRRFLRCLASWWCGPGRRAAG